MRATSTPLARRGLGAFSMSADCPTVRCSVINALSPHAIVHARLIRRAHTVSCDNVHTLLNSITSPQRPQAHAALCSTLFWTCTRDPDTDSFARSTERALAAATCTRRSARPSPTLHTWITIITNALFSPAHVERTYSVAQNVGYFALCPLTASCHFRFYARSQIGARLSHNVSSHCIGEGT
jgi:hypothetical protein